MTEDGINRDEKAPNESSEENPITALVERLDAIESANEELREKNEKLCDQLAAFRQLLGEITPLSRANEFDSAVGREKTEEGTLMFDGSNENYKILGQFAESNGGVGVLGCNTATSGATSGVKGEVDSSNDSAAGVRGVATSDASDAGANGVVGETNSPGSTGGGLLMGTIATGVSGFATNSSAVKSYGVYGSNVSTTDGTAGVFGLSFGGAGTTYGVAGETTSSDQGAAGVSGRATDSSGATYGVSGTTNSDASGAAGVYGESNATDGAAIRGKATGSGTTHGVEGIASSSDGFGLYTADDAKIQNVLYSDLVKTENKQFNVDTADSTDGGAKGIVMGHGANTVLAAGAVIAGGGFKDGNTDDTHNILGDYATITGGRDNNIDSKFGTISGGEGNKIGDFANNKTPTHATVGGGKNNKVTAEAGNYATIGGGENNEAQARRSTVGGGENNEVTASYATVGGGWFNEVKASGGTIAGGTPNNYSDPANSNNVVYDNGGTIGGGGNNQAGTAGDTSGSYATVAGGVGNTASGQYSTICGGEDNTASGYNATVAGGENNTADGADSLVAGRKANSDGFSGTFVWGDSSDQQVKAGTFDEFKVQAGGGVRFYSSSDLTNGVSLSSGNGTWSSVSSRAAKTNISPVKPAETLAKVERLDVSRWEYDGECDADHMGPMAEEFHDAFGLGADEKHIDNVDADGVALAAIQGLSAKLDERDERIDTLEAKLSAKDERIDELEARLDRIEDSLDINAETETSTADD